MIQRKQEILIPSLDLGGTKIDFAFFTADEKRKIALEYPSIKVIKENGKANAERTFRLIAELIKERTREAEKKGFFVLRLLGIGAPGLYMEDKSVDPRTVPNIPDLSIIKPVTFLEDLLGDDWKVYIDNDGIAQAVASAFLFILSKEFATQWSQILEDSGRRIIYFGPGTGFGAGNITTLRDNNVQPVSGNQAFFDILIRDGKTAEDLL
ncbi:MAG: ROK family protein, partial [Spirochaetota bacterium]|nr:ROK family protein [Spirochaetota bacterium]